MDAEKVAAPVKVITKEEKPKAKKEEETVKIETSKLDFDEKDFIPAAKPVVKQAPAPKQVKKVEKKKPAPKKEENTFEIETTTIAAPDIEAPKV